MKDPLIIEIRLTDQQIEIVGPLVRDAVSNRQNVLFIATAAPDLGNWRFQVTTVSFKTGQKLLKLIRADQEEPDV